ncbi:MAG: AAA family ATPase [Planctomycetes bacterium]|nr:AAA family ATPase [Planctomycetota bacterium]
MSDSRTVVIKRLILKRFRSFPADAVTFDNPTFLVGRNGAGKSNFVDVFAFLAECMSTPLQAVFDRRGGIAAVRNLTSGRSYPPNFGMAVELNAINNSVSTARYAFEVKALPNYGFHVVREQCIVVSKAGKEHWFDRHKKFGTNVTGLNPALDPSALCLPVVGGEDRFAPIVRVLGGMRKYSIEPSKLREMQDPDSGTSLRPDGSNAASVLQELRRCDADTVPRVCELLEKIVPNTKTVRSKKHGNKLSLEFVQEWAEKKRLTFEAFNMSDGTLRALGLLMAVFQQPVPSLIAIEEPESTIHPGALGAVLDLLRAAGKMMQVVVTTHSPELLDAKWIKDENLRIVSWNEGASRVMPISEATRTAIRDHLMGAGELLRSNALHPQELFTKELEQGHLFEDLE